MLSVHSPHPHSSLSNRNCILFLCLFKKGLLFDCKQACRSTMSMAAATWTLMQMYPLNQLQINSLTKKKKINTQKSSELQDVSNNVNTASTKRWTEMQARWTGALRCRSIENFRNPMKWFDECIFFIVLKQVQRARLFIKWPSLHTALEHHDLLLDIAC